MNSLEAFKNSIVPGCKVVHLHGTKCGKYPRRKVQHKSHPEGRPSETTALSVSTRLLSGLLPVRALVVVTQMVMPRSPGHPVPGALLASRRVLG